MNIIRKIALIVLIVVAALFIGRNIVLQLFIEYGADVLTGMDVSVKKIDVDFLDTSILVRDLSVKHPKGFDEEYLCLIPRIEIDFDLPKLFSQKVIAFEFIEFDMAKLFIVKNKEGVLNLSLLSANKAVKKDAKKPEKEKVKEEKARAEKKAAPKIYIKQFILSMGEAGFIDEGRPAMKRQVVDMRIKREVFEDITDINAIVSIIMLKLFQNQTIGRLPLGVDVGAVTQGLESFTQGTVNQVDALTASTVKTVSDAAGQITKTGESLVSGVAPDTAKAVGDTVSKSASSVKKAVFGLGSKASELVSGKTEE